jgi:DNA-directed RNA polymerase subunit RPC12/RpoP
MKLSEFFSQYADNSSCKLFFKQKKEEAGVICSTCGSEHHYWIEKESRWRCKNCGKGTSLKTGTVMENSNLDYKVWLWALYLMSLTKKGFSALEMQRLIGHSRYEPIWLLMQKIRISMGHRDDSYQLDAFIEMDEGFFEGHRKKEEECPGAKPVKELDRQVKAIVAVSAAPITNKEEQKKGKPASKPKYLKMSVVSGLNKVEVSREAEKMIKKSATVLTDGRRCYAGLQDICRVHEVMVVKDKTEVSKVFPWVHTAISNAKKKLLGLHHHVKDEYMQNYLSEFCYKFNRRYFGEKLFDRLLITVMAKSWYQPYSK